MTAPVRQIPPDGRHHTRRRWAAVTSALVLFIGTAYWLAQPNSPPLPDGITAAAYHRAAEDWTGLFRSPPEHHDVLMLLAETAVRRNQPELAIGCFEQIPDEHPRYGPGARLQEGQILVKLNRAIAAETSLRRYLELTAGSQPLSAEQAVAVRWLTFLMAVQLRFEERAPLLQQLIDSEHANIYDAKQRYFPSLLLWASSLGRNRLQQFLEQNPDDIRLRTAQARYATNAGELKAARDLLNQLRQEAPDNSAVALATLELVHESGDTELFDQLATELPARQKNEPWLLTQLRGEFHLHRQEWKLAEDHFRTVLRADPASPGSTMGLIRSLAPQQQTTEDDDALRQLRDRSLLLSQVRVQMSEVSTDTPNSTRKLAEQCRLLQMDQAAEVFNRLADLEFQP